MALVNPKKRKLETYCIELTEEKPDKNIKKILKEVKNLKKENNLLKKSMNLILEKIDELQILYMNNQNNISVLDSELNLEKLKLNEECSYIN